MFEFFKNIAEKNACQLSGVCSIHPSVNSLYELLLSEARTCAFYIVKLKEFKICDKKAMAFLVDILSTFLINTSFNQKKYLEIFKKLNSYKNQIKDEYVEYCTKSQLPCEVINTKLEISDNTTINELIEFSQNNIVNRQKSCDKVKFRLFELITIFARLASIDIVKIKKFEPDFNDFDYEILRFFALTNGYSIRDEKIIRRILEFSDISLKIHQKLFDVYKNQFGEKQDASVTMNYSKGHCILVSGDDLDELKKLLTTLENMKNQGLLEEDVNVYTNGALFLAHFYPYFKNNKFLKGHYGTDNAEYDFSNFPGAILITKNFIQKIDSLYRGEIFSNKFISFNKVFDIQNDNYEPVICSAQKLEGFLNDENKKIMQVGYDSDDVGKIVDNFDEKEVVIITGKIEGKTLSYYNNKKVINLNCPCEEDILLEAIRKLKAKNVEITIFFAQCNLVSLFMVLSLLNQGLKIALANCPQALINPHVIESLKEDFNIEIV